MFRHERTDAFDERRLVAPGVISFLVLTFICSETGFAQTSDWPKHREYGVEAFGGASFVRNFQFLTPVSGSIPTATTVGMHYASGYMIGLRITQNLGDFAAADLEYSFANQPLRFINLTPDIPSLSLGHSVQHFSYNVSYLPLPLEKRLRPYGSIGAGAVWYHISKGSKNEAAALGVGLNGNWEFAFSAGGGLKYLVQDQFALTFNVKDQISGVP